MNCGIIRATRRCYRLATAPCSSKIWRLSRPEGTTLSTADTLESNPASGTPEESQGHEGHDHEHDPNHEHQPHEHQHGPVLNPDCTRELVLDVPAEEVSKAFRNVVRNYQK